MKRKQIKVKIIIKNYEEMKKLGIKNVEKHKLHSAKKRKKKTICINDINIDDILVSNKIKLEKRALSIFFVDANYSNDAIGPLLMKLPKRNQWIKWIHKMF